MHKINKVFVKALLILCHMIFSIPIFNKSADELLIIMYDFICEKTDPINANWNEL